MNPSNQPKPNDEPIDADKGLDYALGLTHIVPGHKRELADPSSNAEIVYPDAQAEAALRSDIDDLLLQRGLIHDAVGDSDFLDAVIALFQADKSAAVRAEVLSLKEDIEEAFDYEANFWTPVFDAHLARLQPPTAGEGESV